MIWTIANRELHSNITTFRFLISLILSLALITASAFIFALDYGVRLSEYNANSEDHKERLEGIKVHVQIESGAERFPSPLGFLSIGSDKKLGNTISGITFKEVPREAVGHSGGNFLMNMFPFLDMALIVRIVLSLLALLLSYDAISGERETGTLAIMLSNSVPRHHILLGKIIGGMISIAIPLATGLLAGLIVVSRYSPSVLNVSEWIRIGLVFLCSLLYLLAIFMLGILVSARTKGSATSLVILLFIWVILVMLWPNMGSYVARQTLKVEDKAVVDTKREALERELGDSINRLSLKQREAGPGRPPKLYRYAVGSRKTEFTGDIPYPSYMQYLDREDMLWFLEGIKLCVPLQMEYADKVWELYRAYEAELRRQVAFSENLSRISPAWTYYNAISVLSRTDYGVYTRFMDQARQYRQQLVDYTNSRRGYTTPSFFTTMKMSDTLTYQQLEEIDAKHGDKAIRKLQESFWPKAPELKVPIFRHQQEPLMESISRTLPDVTILILLNTVFFLAAYASFVRQEVK